MPNLQWILPPTDAVSQGASAATALLLAWVLFYRAAGARGSSRVRPKAQPPEGAVTCASLSALWIRICREGGSKILLHCMRRRGASTGTEMVRVLRADLSTDWPTVGPT